MRTAKITILLVALAGVALYAENRIAPNGKLSVIDEHRLEGLFRAPDFPKQLEWLNTDHPLSIKDLKGKVVLLDFWTYCCINCMHVIPDLKKLEAKYPNELVVVGVHSAKFKTEKGTENIRKAILRYGIKHPVINDNKFIVWNSYGVSSWPTLVLINPNGKIIGVQPGEGAFDVFDPLIAQTIKHFDKKNEIDRKPLALKLESAVEPESFLAFPGKIYADPKSKRLFISDSNHHRILITDSEGKVLQTIGSGAQGALDGDFQTASFNQPQGTFVDGENLYIADTENHLVRKADLTNGKVTTLLGTGKQARGFNQSGKATKVALNSPWDLTVIDGKLYIAMAGPHQLWIADLGTLEAKPYAGSGSEGRHDDKLLEAALAQPSAVTTDGKKLYFADSEVSSIRSADLNPKGKVETIIGEDLFEFGDIDGDQSIARLQHPLGVVYHEGLLYVADTYNCKIKVIDPVKKTSSTLAGTGKHGMKEGLRSEAEFNEPGGITVLDDKLYVADTNNHQIRIIDLKSNLVTTLQLDAALAKTSTT